MGREESVGCVEGVGEREEREDTVGVPVGAGVPVEFNPDPEGVGVGVKVGAAGEGEEEALVLGDPEPVLLGEFEEVKETRCGVPLLVGDTVREAVERAVPVPKYAPPLPPPPP